MQIFRFLSNDFWLLSVCLTICVLWPLSHAKGSVGKSASELKCLALNIYFETRGEPQIGQIGVGMVTLNRARSGKFQPTVCGVVYAKSQFSWTFDEHSNVPPAGKVWTRTVTLARKILNGKVSDPTNKASHFFNPRKANPTWRHKFTHTATLGNHRFYRMPGFIKSLKSGLMKNSFEFDGSPDLQEVLWEQHLQVDSMEHSERYQQFLSYIDELPLPESSDNMDNYEFNPEKEGSRTELPRVIEL